MLDQSRYMPSKGALENETSEVGHDLHWGTRMYAIAFDMDTKMMQQKYPGPSYENGYHDIEKVLNQKGFKRQQGSVYFPKDPQKINSIACVVAIRELSRKLPWFRDSVRDVRMLRIEEFNDLRPVLFGELE